MTPPTKASEAMESATYRKVTLHLMPFLFLCYVLAYINRVNVSFAKLQMQADLGMSDEVYGLGAGMFFVGYFFFNVPSNMVLKKIGARGLLGPMLLVRGILSALMMFVHGSTSYYVLRFIGGAVEAGFFPGVVLYLTFWYTTKTSRPDDGLVHERNSDLGHLRRPAFGLDSESHGRGCRAFRVAVAVYHLRYSVLAGGPVGALRVLQ